MCVAIFLVSYQYNLGVIEIRCLDYDLCALLHVEQIVHLLLQDKVQSPFEVPIIPLTALPSSEALDSAYLADAAKASVNFDMSVVRPSLLISSHLICFNHGHGVYSTVQMRRDGI